MFIFIYMLSLLGCFSFSSVKTDVFSYKFLQIMWCLSFSNAQSRNGSRELLGVVPRLPFRSDVGMAGGSTDGFRGVLMPDGVDVPLKFRLILFNQKNEKKKMHLENRY